MSEKKSSALPKSAPKAAAFAKSPVGKLVGGAIAVLLALLGWNLNDEKESETPETSGIETSAPKQDPPQQDQRIQDQRILVDVPGVGVQDLTDTLARIERGESHSHRNDGSVFQNREGLLPKKPDGYYREYVHPTPGQSGPGARRVVLGDGGDIYYTHDHYESFLKVEKK